MDALGWQARATVVVAMRAGLGREVARGDVILAACVAVLVALGVRQHGRARVCEPAAVAARAEGRAALLNPIGYQTHLMMMPAGGYRFADFARTGIPVTIAFSVVAVAMVALLWL